MMNKELQGVAPVEVELFDQASEDTQMKRYGAATMSSNRTGGNRKTILCYICNREFAARSL